MQINYFMQSLLQTAYLSFCHMDDKSKQVLNHSAFHIWRPDEKKIQEAEIYVSNIVKYITYYW